MATPISSPATYSGKKFTVGDTIYFSKFGTRVDSGYASNSGKYGTCHARISELYSSSYAFPIRITGTVTTPSSGTFTGCTVKPSDVSKGYQVTVTYNKNGGSSGTASQTGYVGASLTGTASRTGYTFAGWYTSASGGSKVTTIPTTANTTYYAHWTAKSYTVTFNANGGSSTTTKSETYGSKYIFPSNPTRTGYTFAGWYTAASGGSKVTTSTTVATASAHTVYAHWTANTYYVAFNGNGATGTMTNQTHTYGTSLALSPNTFDRSPTYAFNNWNTQADGTGTSYANQASVLNLTSTNGATVTLYAQWDLQYISPSIDITHAYRSDSNGDMSDAGTYLHIEADITVDTTISTLAGTTNYVKTIKIYTKKKDANIWDSKLELNIAASELTSYHLDQVISGYLTTFSYDIRIDVTDTYGSDDLHITDPQASASDILSLAFYTLDFSAGDPNALPDPIPGGHGVGIGAPAPAEGLRIGLDTEFEGDVTTGGDMSVSQNITAGGDITDGDGNVLSNVADALSVIGTVYTFAWNKSSAGGTGTAITGEATLPAGTYIIVVQAPVISATTTMQIQGISGKYFTAQHNHETAVWVGTFNSATAIQLQMAQSGTVTFSYTDRGGMKAIRIA